MRKTFHVLKLTEILFGKSLVRKHIMIASSSSSSSFVHSVTPECPRMTARLQRSAGGVPSSPVVPAELVKPPVPRAAWTSPPTRVWKATEWQIYVVPPLRQAWWAGVSILRKSGFVTRPNTELRACDDGRLDPAHDRDLSVGKRLCSAHGPANVSGLFGVGLFMSTEVGL